MTIALTMSRNANVRDRILVACNQRRARSFQPIIINWPNRRFQKFNFYRLRSHPVLLRCFITVVEILFYLYNRRNGAVAPVVDCIEADARAFLVFRVALGAKRLFLIESRDFLVWLDSECFKTVVGVVLVRLPLVIVASLKIKYD